MYQVSIAKQDYAQNLLEKVNLFVSLCSCYDLLQQ